jgi:iron-sulfur cluster repair protein YtfE (RIC family)
MNKTGVDARGRKQQAFLTSAEALRRVHEALHEDLQALEDAARASGGQPPTELARRLIALRERLATHIVFEEQGGYMKAVRESEPRLEPIVQKLEDDHKRVMQSLCDLIGKAERAAADGKLSESVIAWIGDLREHEARENEVFEEAFNSDLGAED